jgi:hypothetical protein
MAKHKDILLAFIKSAKILDNEGVLELENQEEGAELTEELETAINTGIDRYLAQIKKDEADKARSEGHGKGTREARVKLEKDLKEKYGVESDKTGVELIDEIVEKATVAGAKDPSKMTPEELLKLPTVAQLKDQLAKKTKELDDLSLSNQELTAFKTQAEQREFNKTIATEAISIFKTLGPALPDDTAKAEAQTKLFENLVLSGKYKVEEESGKKVIYLVDSEGNYVRGERDSRVTIADHVKGLTEQYFGVVKQDPKAGTGNKNETGAQSGGYKPPVMNSREDLDKALATAKTAEERAATMKAWEEKK